MNSELQSFMERLFSESPLNRLPDSHGGGRIFGPPLIGVARGDDPIFQDYKSIIGPEHLTPAEVWNQNGLTPENDSAGRLRVISIVFPFVDSIRQENLPALEMPTDRYSIGRNYADDLMREVQAKTCRFFKDRDFQATPGLWLNPGFRVWIQGDPLQVVSRWSERHIAFAAGLGTFSLHEALITEAGCNVRLVSVITDAPLRVTPRLGDQPYANCLHFALGACVECVDRCPAGAITTEGHDKRKCREYGHRVRAEKSKRLASILKPRRVRTRDGGWIEEFGVGCAICQFNVPCMDKNPMAKKQARERAGLQPTG